MSTKRAEAKTKGVILKFRVDEDVAFTAQMIADGETGGNVSSLLRKLLERKVEEKRAGKRRAA